MVANAITIRLLGEFTAQQGETAVANLDTPRLQALLACLALRSDTPQPRQQLAFTLWPSSDERQARTNLRNLLHRLRQSWPAADQFLSTSGKNVGWRPGVALHLDTAVFQQAIAQAQTAVSPADALPHWLSAIAHYHGDLLPGCYDDWIAPERDRLRQLFLQALEGGLAAADATDDVPTAIRLAQQLITCDSLHEFPYRKLMALYLRQGDRAAALRVYSQCAAVLRRELGVDPAPETQEAYRQLLALDTAAPPTPPLETDLIGRQVEWAQLTAIWQQTAAGQRAPFLLISGEAGVGKTRLAEEFIAWARQQGGATAVATCYAAETQLAFGPVADWLRALPLDNLAPIWRGELARLLPELLPAPAEQAPISEPWQQRRFYEAVAQAIAAQRPPICLLLEDAQWADGETLAWLHYLLRRENQTGLLLLATWRPDDLSGEALPALLRQWREQGRLLEIPLAPLAAAETAELAATLLDQPLPDALTARLHQQTEGNPLFIVETLRHALGDNQPISLGRLERQLRPGEEETAVTLPPKMVAVIKARLGQLSPTAYSLVEAASVIGRSFTLPTLQQASGVAEEALIGAVDEMWRRRIVRDRAAEVYDFTHGKLRQVAYQAISPARRRWLHGRVAQTLAAQEANAPDGALAGRVAFHYEAAGQAERAFAAHRRAAPAARQVYARAEEAFHAERAIALHAPALAAPGELADLYAQLGRARAALGQHEAARQAFRAALGALPPQAGAARAEMTLALGKSWLAQYELALARQTFAEIPALLGDPAVFSPAEWRVWLDARLEQFDAAYYAANLEEMAALVAEMEPLLARHGDTRQRIRFYQAQAQWHSRQTRFRHTAEGVAAARAALELALTTGDEGLGHNGRFGLGFMLLWQAQPDLAGAVAELEQAAAGAQAIANVPLLDRCLAYLTIAYRLQGDEARVGELLPQSAAVAASEENSSYLGVAAANRAWLAARDGRWAEALAEAEGALAQWQSLVFPFHWLACWPGLAAAAALGEWATAVALARLMLAPEQQKLAEEVREGLATAVANPSFTYFQQALALACQHHMF